ncbi:MAG: hypothetical protein R3E39_24450 [Anaerolineae bacterium]
MNILLVALICVIFGMLMVFAGQPITPEAELVQQWYEALCNPGSDQAPLWELTWRGDMSQAQLKEAIEHYRERGGLPQPCKPVVDVNVIYFQWIPPELHSSYERIKFVAVNVYGEGRPTERNLIGSEQTGVHVLFDGSGKAFILPRFLAQSPLGIQETGDVIPLYNNDGLLMGNAQVTGEVIRLQRFDEVRLGVPLRLEATSNWGRYEAHVFVNGLEVIPEFYGDVLPPEEQERFLPPAQDAVSRVTEMRGVLWVQAKEPVTSLHVGFEIFQTPWDMRPLPALVRVVINDEA